MNRPRWRFRVADRLAIPLVFGAHVSHAEEKPKFKNNLTRVREGLGLSQPDFARKLGVSASIIKKVEAGKRTLSQDLSAAIFAETGRLLISAPEETPLEYTTEGSTRRGRRKFFSIKNLLKEQSEWL